MDAPKRRFRRKGALKPPYQRYLRLLEVLSFQMKSSFRKDIDGSIGLISKEGSVFLIRAQIDDRVVPKS